MGETGGVGMKLSNEELEHLFWIQSRLVQVHKENPTVDYMVKFNGILLKLITDKYVVGVDPAYGNDRLVVWEGEK